jgi:DNA-directed RNA polymerase sigma subunit (sigma70/sigma32)
MDKERELATWKKWKRTKDPALMSDLLKSMDPYLQSHVNKFSTSPLPRQAIESQARILAVKGFHTYDPTKGAALNTHLGHELKHLTRYVLEYQNVGKIPENRGIAISRFQNIKSNLTEELGREPTVLELADKLQWSAAETERMQTELRQDLNVVQGKEEAFFDTGFNTSDRTMDIVQFVYYSVDPEQQKVLEYWYGLGGAPRLTVDEMALRLNKSPAQIREMSKALAAKIHEAGG